MGILKKNTQAADASDNKFETAEETNSNVDGADADQVDQVDTPDTKTEVRSTPRSAGSSTKSESKPDSEDKKPAPQTQSTSTAVAKSLIKYDEQGNPITALTAKGAGANFLARLEDAFQAAGMEVDYRTFPKLRVDAGVIATAEGKEAGAFIELQIISWGKSRVVGTGDDSEEGKKAVRFSDDGVTIKGANDEDEHAGKTLEEYVAHLKSIGFEKASIKDYTNIYGIALEAAEVDFPLHEMYCISLSPTATGIWTSYLANRAIAAKIGKVKETSANPVVRFTTDRRKSPDNKSYHTLVASHGVNPPLDL